MRAQISRETCDCIVMAIMENCDSPYKRIVDIAEQHGVSSTIVIRIKSIMTNFNMITVIGQTRAQKTHANIKLTDYHLDKIYCTYIDSRIRKAVKILKDAAYSGSVSKIRNNVVINKYNI